MRVNVNVTIEMDISSVYNESNKTSIDKEDVHEVAIDVAYRAMESLSNWGEPFGKTMIEKYSCSWKMRAAIDDDKSRQKNILPTTMEFIQL